MNVRCPLTTRGLPIDISPVGFPKQVNGWVMHSPPFPLYFRTHSWLQHELLLHSTLSCSSPAWLTGDDTFAHWIYSMRMASHIDFCSCGTLTPVLAKCNFTSRNQAKSSLAVYSRPVDRALPQLFRQQDLWLERNYLAATQLPTWHPNQARTSALPARKEGRFCVHRGEAWNSCQPQQQSQIIACAGAASALLQWEEH